MKENQYQFRLSIIVAIYNVEAYLERCLSSIVKQDLQPEEYEILLINDGSIDGSLAIAQKYERQYSNVKVFSKENGGLSSVRNFGIENSKGRYIMHVDGDDFLEENVVGKVVKVAEENELDLLFYGSKSTNGCVHRIGPFPLYKVLTGEHILLNGMEVGSVWKNLYSRQLLKQTGIVFYGNISHQDVEYNYRLYALVRRLMFSDILVYNYNIENESITRTKDVRKIEKKAMDDLTVVANVMAFSKNVDVSRELKAYYERKMNSLLVSKLLEFFHKGSPFSFSFVKFFIDEAKHLSVYPIVGQTSSLRTTKLIKWFNMKWLYLTMFLFFRVIKKCGIELNLFN